jgi:hypothetical protein
VNIVAAAMARNESCMVFPLFFRSNADRGINPDFTPPLQLGAIEEIVRRRLEEPASHAYHKHAY